MTGALTGRKVVCEYADTSGVEDHICDYSDLRKMKPRYSARRIARSLEQMFLEILPAWRERSRELEGMLM